MKYTGNYNLKKPEGSDVVNIEDLNDNADIIDSELKKLNDAIKDLDADGITLPDGKTISEKFEEITEEVGNIQELNTDEKANIVAAINEINQALLTHQQNTNQEIGQVASDLAAHKADNVTEDNKGHVQVDGETIFALEGGIITTKNPEHLWLYDRGNEYTGNTGGWVAGYSEGAGEQSKEPTFLSLSIPRVQGVKYRTYVTDNKIDLSSVNFLYIEWDMTSEDANPMSSISVSQNKTSKHHINPDAILSNGAPFRRKIDILDVSNLTGEYYIKISIHHSVSSQSIGGDLRVFAIWGVE